MIYFALGVIIGFVFNLLIPKKKDGVLRIDSSDPMKDTYTFELDTLDDFDKGVKKKYFILEVVKDENID